MTLRYPSLFILAVLWTNDSHAFANPYFDARSLAMGNTYVARADFFGIAHNPASLSQMTETQDVIILLPSVLKTNLRNDKFETKHDNLLHSRDRYIDSPNNDTENVLVNALQDMQDTSTSKEISVNAAVALPNLPVSLAAYFQVTSQTISATFSHDAAQLSPTSVALNQTVEKKTISLMEGGITLSKNIAGSPGGSNLLSVGISPKLQSMRSSYSQTEVENFYSAPNPSDKNFESQFNINIGLLQTFNYTWKMGVVVRDLLRGQTRFANGEEAIEIKPTISAGLSKRFQRSMFALDIDLSRNSDLFYKDQQWWRSGYEYIVTKNFRVQAGYRQNLQIKTQDHLAAGVSFQGRLFRSDIGVSANNREYILSATLGLAF